MLKYNKINWHNYFYSKSCILQRDNYFFIYSQRQFINIISRTPLCCAIVTSTLFLTRVSCFLPLICYKNTPRYQGEVTQQSFDVSCGFWLENSLNSSFIWKFSATSVVVRQTWCSTGNIFPTYCVCFKPTKDYKTWQVLKTRNWTALQLWISDHC